jgi:hypothetical protein
MDGAFLKFWGEFLLQAAAGQRQIEELTRWVQNGLPSSGELADLFRRCYGLSSGSTPETGAPWEEATADFREALEAYAPLWGWVPLDRYDQLREENESLKAQLSEQARLIKRLEALMEDEDMGHMTMVARFQNLIADQSKAFDDLMQKIVPPSEAPDENQT